MSPKKKKRIRYVAELSNVREVSLVGSANLSFWTDRLHPDGLEPIDRNGQAQLLLSAVDSRFMGVRFREFVVTVAACPASPERERDGHYLPQAFNTSRCFAFIERHWFATPYDHGSVDIDISPATSMQVVATDGGTFRAEMAADAPASRRQPIRQDAEGWQGPIYLPRRDANAKGRGKLFFAKFGGLAKVYPFLAAQDRLTIRPSAGSPVLQCLAESEFTPTEWSVRDLATHARSMTYRR